MELGGTVAVAVAVAMGWLENCGPGSVRLGLVEFSVLGSWLSPPFFCFEKRTNNPETRTRGGGS